ncbi:Aste57867_19801 [Aphanomyces stellatus]|uniref:Aste57867_19801 protein n=1 Tax=Aphanomyces stellatus TaxID=120398 RepID=A0A485LDK2_9STRA|nr:hypothetical protein As57867_019736 [Aphanomyces stellatus]VFT96499.1 Aste57867_19801 [Aphanomyces stellatus]
MLLFLACLLAWSEAAMTLLDACNTTTSSYCLRDGINGSITQVAILSTNSVLLDLSNQHIATIAILPTLPLVIDLSFNRIQVLPQVDSPTLALSNVRQLNLSHNLFTTPPKPLPRSVEILYVNVGCSNHDMADACGHCLRDLSYNSLTGFDWVLTCPLTQLSLKGNNLGSVILTVATFPANLTTLDLSQNPQLVLTLDDVVFAKVTRPGFKLTLATNKTRTAATCTTFATLQGQNICLLKTLDATNGPYSIPPFLMGIALVISLFVGYCVSICRMWCFRSKESELFERGTICSSVVDEKDFEIALTPIHIQHSMRFV